MKRAIGYVRVSTDEQASTGVSLSAQADKIRAYAQLYDLELIEIIEDAGSSAKTLVRPGLQRALTMLNEGTAEALVVAKLDRLTRSVRDLGELIDTAFSDKGAALMSVSEQIDTRTAGGRLVLNILASVSQWEREAIGERTATALDHKRKARKVYCHSVYGFDRDGDQLIPNPQEQDILARMQTDREAGRSLRWIAEALNSERIATKRGGSQWYASTVKSVLGASQ